MRGPAEVAVRGQLAPFAQGYIDDLFAQGYARVSAAEQLRLMAHLSRWLGEKRMRPQDLTAANAKSFLSDRRAAGYAGHLSRRAIEPLLAHLHSRQILPHVSPPPTTPLDVLMGRYREYLRRERSLVEATIDNYEPLVRRFVDGRWPSGRIQLGKLSAADVIEFVVRCCRGQGAVRAKTLVPALRSFLRFLFLEGALAQPLASAVPRVATWSLSALPKVIEPRCVARLLRSCDRRTALGRRDAAILVVLLRLGLRASEVCGLRLDDIDWRNGVIRVVGKGPQEDQLHLPPDVAHALIEYVRQGRPHASCRSLFLRNHAPYRWLTRHGINNVVAHACDRAGVPRVGPHRFRHTAASRMLAAGAPLGDIAMVLRHRCVSSTAIYAKVDRHALRSVGLRWPGGRP